MDHALSTDDFAQSAAHSDSTDDGATTAKSAGKKKTAAKKTAAKKSTAAARAKSTAKKTTAAKKSSSAKSTGTKKTASATKTPASKKAAKKAAKKATSKKSKADDGTNIVADRAAGAAAKGKSLVIVESPAKAKTINKFLGSSFLVKSSVGHVRDLPEKGLGIDLENNFTPKYVTLDRAKKVIAELKGAAQTASKVYLAPDPDREGEAIAWHLKEVLSVDPEKLFRIEFNEITKTAVQNALTKPRSIDQNRVNAQQARRFLDRLVGYPLSKLLGKKITRGLSAGRVQSIALRLIVEREREIRAFVSHKYWTIDADVKKTKAATDAEAMKFTMALKQWAATDAELKLKLLPEFEAAPEEWAEKVGVKAGSSPAEIYTAAIKKLKTDARGHFALNLEPKDDLKQQPFVDGIVTLLKKATYAVSSVKVQKKHDRPRPPFITSTLQRAASTVLGFSASRTMMLAQHLYEGIDVGDGPVGLITYMRTDSTRLADEAVTACRDYIDKTFGNKYLPAQPRAYEKKKAKGAQDAHEAIRPTNVELSPDAIKSAFTQTSKTSKNTRDHWRLYELIWKQFVACQMADHEYMQTTVEATADRGLLRCSGREEVFDGFKRLWKTTAAQEDDDPNREAEDEQQLPPLKEGDPLTLLEVKTAEKETKPPARYSEASLVKTLEAEGIGRPSTYAAILSKIAGRGYVKLENRRFFAQELGETVSDMLVAHFPREMAVQFTAKMEESLDKVEEGEVDYVDMLRTFWDDFNEQYTKAEAEMPSQKGKDATPVEGVECPKCGAGMVQRWSKFGKFLGCVKYPECDGMLTIDGGQMESRGPEPSEYTCDKCGKPLVYRIGKRGRFLGCTGYPDCKNTKQIDKEGKPLPDIDVKCEKCGSQMALKTGPRGRFLGCTNYPKCRSTKPMTKELAAELFGDSAVADGNTNGKSDGNKTPAEAGTKAEEK